MGAFEAQLKKAMALDNESKGKERSVEADWVGDCKLLQAKDQEDGGPRCPVSRSSTIHHDTTASQEALGKLAQEAVLNGRAICYCFVQSLLILGHANKGIPSRSPCLHRIASVSTPSPTVGS
ncbi:Proteasome subunit alpha type-4 [Fusarium oxysporum f. sp. albedinis]|nr:Proteasome subunit alpha type-4 [Fusarium oxysporum f. sp. albedinis]